MKRRLFLSAIASAFVADPERLLWRPDAKLISIPRPRQKVLLVEEWIMRDALRILRDNGLVLERQLREKARRDLAFLIGDKWEVRKPTRLVLQS